MSENISVFDLSQLDGPNALVKFVRDSYASAAKTSGRESDVDDTAPPPADVESITVVPFPELIGVDASVYRQIEAALRSGKRHLMFYGPPGTGKTEIARRLAGLLSPNWRLITGSADWTSQDIIGGYQPVGDGRIEFVPGVLLREFDRPLIIDELNRCDIDKVIGPLFTVLSGQASTLPYRVDVADRNSEQYVILPLPKPGSAPHEYAPSSAWRIIATINSIDKASLYQMSYALTRRFGWVFVDVPTNLGAFVAEYLGRAGLIKSSGDPSQSPVVKIWGSINNVRPIGAAPIIDWIDTTARIKDEIDFLVAADPTSVTAYLDGFYMYLLPMLDGILQQDAEEIAKACLEGLGVNENEPTAKEVTKRLMAMAI